MRTYLIKRLLLFVPTALLVSIAIFSMQYAIPGDYATSVLLANVEDAVQATEADFERIREQMGLDGLPHERYARWLGNIFQGDLGNSFANRKPVMERTGRRLFLSFELGVIAVALACILGTIGGVISAVRQDTWIDYLLRGSSMTFRQCPASGWPCWSLAGWWRPFPGFHL